MEQLIDQSRSDRKSYPLNSGSVVETAVKVPIWSLRWKFIFKSVYVWFGLIGSLIFIAIGIFSVFSGQSGGWGWILVGIGAIFLIFLISWFYFASASLMKRKFLEKRMS